MTQPTLENAKAQAKALRQALEQAGTQVSHAQALELIARQHGARDWNTLHARLTQRNTAPELALGVRVKGQYLGQAYCGEIVGLSGSEAHRHVEIKLDQPVDTVRFESFSNWRHRIRGTLDMDRRSHRKTSDGTPHLSVERVLP
ncbi:glyoxalase superfamily protein [Tropicimonas sp. TH_r6]|uniref:glyoxalase superfamily protein n=1 Tax=Tropicimonas sp. TH_r6 TaxID=3082085 RepID=UPI00295352E4|nr:glyoxalase superfamily protein [Tropicimonas sp. TH_r6]MDV7141883.1 glyoxalase superfamily protein [Tropicimonas sp. TH_r6]